MYKNLVLKNKNIKKVILFKNLIKNYFILKKSTKIKLFIFYYSKEKISYIFNLK